MSNKELQNLLKDFPDDMEVRLLPKDFGATSDRHIVPFSQENILHTSESAYINDEAPEEEWDSEDGKIELGDGKQYLLINPIIV